MSADFWNERYAENEYVYGETPNKFLAEKLEGITPGKILFPADGEGRNSVYAATRGWDTYAFDQSAEGKKKAELLAQKSGVTIKYEVASMPDVHYKTQSFDAMALIFAHFPGGTKIKFLQQLGTYVKPGGIVIFEAYSKSHLKFKADNPRVGGPSDETMLYTTEEIKACFPNFEAQQLEETELEIWEGKLHGGMSSVIRFVGRKHAL
ncbi:MAG: class I SAM-dependent methyltransferase [Taibaiella sp.]|nr:class I SAM-dependent methyltransferase [Taibaiella sp.]